MDKVQLRPTEDNAVANALNLLDATQKEVVQIANDAYDVAKQSQAVGLDILMFHKSSLVQFDAQWGAKQFRQGTAFVGINVSPQELGELIDMPAITSNWGYILKEPFVTYMVIQVYGNPDHIKKAEQAGALYPPNGEILAKLGFRDLMVGQGSGYTDLRNTELSMILEGIRLNLDRQNLVKPSLP